MFDINDDVLSHKLFYSKQKTVLQWIASHFEIEIYSHQNLVTKFLAMCVVVLEPVEHQLWNEACQYHCNKNSLFEENGRLLCGCFFFVSIQFDVDLFLFLAFQMATNKNYYQCLVNNFCLLLYYASSNFIYFSTSSIKWLQFTQKIALFYE